jgi:putative transposase
LRRRLPHDFRDGTAVRYDCDPWPREGTWEAVKRRLVEEVRPAAGPADGGDPREPKREDHEAGWERGYDGKKLQGRNRQPWVDAEGHLLAVSVETATRGDRDGAR